jgi:copper chaperone CopZ
MGIFGKKKNSLTLKVPGMHCANCERRVKVILESVPGVVSATPDADAGTVVVGMDANAPASEQTIRDELAAGGYPTE